MLDLDPRSLSSVRRILAEYVPGAEVWAHGSRVTGDAHEGSDLDLVVRNTADLARPQPDLTRLRAALRDSDLTVCVDVADWARLSASFRRRVLRGYIQIQAPGRDADAAVAD